MKDGMYRFIVGVLDLFLWGGELIGEENLPKYGPAVFISNHLEATGPIAAACSIPLRMYSWSVADMVDEEKAAAWLKWDFVERTLHIQPPASAWVANWLSRLTVPFLRSLGCIPVYKGDYDRMAETLQLSMNVLRDGRCLLVFPEDNLLALNPATGMKPFQRSFVRLGEMWYAETGERLDFYPVAVHPSGFVVFGKAETFNPNNALGLERHRLKYLMEDSIVKMYQQLEGNDSGMLKPQVPQGSH